MYSDIGTPSILCSIPIKLQPPYNQEPGNTAKISTSIFAWVNGGVTPPGHTYTPEKFYW